MLQTSTKEALNHEAKFSISNQEKINKETSYSPYSPFDLTIQSEMSIYPYNENGKDFKGLEKSGTDSKSDLSSIDETTDGEGTQSDGNDENKELCLEIGSLQSKEVYDEFDVSNDESNDRLDKVLRDEGDSLPLTKRKSPSYLKKMLSKSLSKQSLETSFGPSNSSYTSFDCSEPISRQSSFREPISLHGEILDVNSRDNSATCPWGWFNSESVDEKLQQSKNIRQAWLDITLNKDASSSKLSGETTGNNDVSSCDNDEDSNVSRMNVLFQWRNPNPSMSMRTNSSGDKMNNSELFGGFDMRLSCCIAGYRTVQLSNGEICAEFQFIFSYGSITFNTWKRFSEYKKFFDIIKTAHKFLLSEGSDGFRKAILEWRNLRARQRWFRSLSVVYLIEKSVYLGRFMQNVLLESENPGLLLYFARNKLI